MVGGGEVGIEVPLVALTVRMACQAVGGRRFHPLVSFSASCWALKKGRSSYAVCILVATLVKTPVRPMWYCGASFGGVVTLVSAH